MAFNCSNPNLTIDGKPFKVGDRVWSPYTWDTAKGVSGWGIIEKINTFGDGWCDVRGEDTGYTTYLDGTRFATYKLEKD
jgi:hypothetical protein